MRIKTTAIKRVWATPVLVCWIALTCLAGCSNRIDSYPNPTHIGGDQYSDIYHAAIEVLREQHFIVTRADFRYGIIITEPLISPTVFEPWYDTNSTTSLAVQSTLNEERRLVKVTLKPRGTSGIQLPVLHSGSGPTHSYSLAVQVEIERHRITNRTLTGSTSGRRVFGTLKATPAELRDSGISENYWEPVGRDSQLEQRLIDAIIRTSSAATQENPSTAKS